jgi:DNA end-binding protein Ku
MARAIWSGSVSFGLVNVPVKLYGAVTPKDVHFHQLEEDTGARIRYKRVSDETGEEVPYDHIVKGYEIARGTYVPIEPEELEAVEPEATHTVDIEDFVSLEDIDPVHYDDTYYLVPDGAGAAKAYALLAKAMEETGRVAVGRFVMRTKQHLVAIRPLDGVLALHTLFYADELVDRADLEGVPSGTKVGKKELEAARRLVDSLTTDWDPSAYHDTYREEVLEMVQRKAEGEEVVTEAPKEHKAEVLDLMAALEASLAGRRSGRGGKAAGKASGKAASTGKKKAAAPKKASGSKRSAAGTTSSRSSPKASTSKGKSSKPAGKAAKKATGRARKSA